MADLEAKPTEPVVVDEDNHDEDGGEDEYENRKPMCSCDAMRKKLKAFLATKAMTQSKLLETMHVNSNSFQRFMHLKGQWNGLQNGTFWGAQTFFKKQIALTKAAKKTMTKEEKAAATAHKTAQATALQALLVKVGQVSLADQEGEDEQLPIYDDCDDVRKKVLQFLAQTGMTQSRFLTMLNINSNSWGKFVKYAGPCAGAGNQAYTKGYKFMEKVRIARGEPKTAKRIKNEVELGPRGF